MATRAADLMFRCVFDGSLSMCNMDIERRPYHRNCKCPLHEMIGKCSQARSQQRNVSFPRREFTDKCSFSVSASTITSQSSYVHSSLTGSREAPVKVQLEFSCSNEQCERSVDKI